MRVFLCFGDGLLKRMEWDFGGVGIIVLVEGGVGGFEKKWFCWVGGSWG